MNVIERGRQQQDRSKYDDVPAVAAAKAECQRLCAEAQDEYATAEAVWVAAGEAMARKVKRATNALRVARLQAEVDDIKATLA